MMLRLAAIIVLLSACERKSEKYCAMNPEDLANCPRMDAEVMVDARPSCTSTSSTCGGMAPHCLLTNGMNGVCVGCLIDGHCPAPSKCDMTSYTCRGCVKHSDCESKACLPDGMCGVDQNTIYVSDQGTNNATCTAAMPCATIAHGLTKLTSSRYHLKLDGMFTGPITIDNRRVVILGGPATISGGDPTLKMQSTARVDLYDVNITGGTCVRVESTSTVGLRRVNVSGCATYGVDVENSYLTMARSRVTMATRGGIFLRTNARFDIASSIIANNGNNTEIGGVSIETTTTNNRFEHNTVVGNLAKQPNTGGVTCPAGPTIDLRFNIIAGNSTNGGIDNNVIGGCTRTSSLVTDNVAGLALSPMFKLTAGSTLAIDKVDSTIADDIDGDFRPQGAKSDYGADEFKP